MKGYTTREVADVLGLPTSTILTWTRNGLLSPRRGPRGAYVFSFQDVALLRSARELLHADISTRRVRETFERLREQLPAGRPLSAVSVSAAGGHIFAQDDEGTWEPGSGQLQIDFRESGSVPAPLPAPPKSEADAEALEADDWYDRAVDLEAFSSEAAKEAYGRALARDPEHADAHLNLGRLIHEEGDISRAEVHYRRALLAEPHNARAYYNLGVALDDEGHRTGAIEAYQSALRADAGLAVAHFNLSRLLEAAGRKAEALAHLATYKRLLEDDEAGS